MAVALSCGAGAGPGPGRGGGGGQPPRGLRRQGQRVSGSRSPGLVSGWKTQDPRMSCLSAGTTSTWGQLILAP